MPSTISFAVTDASGNSVTGSLSYNAATNTIIFTPNDQLAAVDPVHGDRQRGHRLPRPYDDRSGDLVVHHRRRADLHALSATRRHPRSPRSATPPPIELGVKFESAVPGYITGIRFYKGAGNTGTHVGHLWTSTGTLLATATFTNETAAGWQQVDLRQSRGHRRRHRLHRLVLRPQRRLRRRQRLLRQLRGDQRPAPRPSNAAAGGNGVFARRRRLPDQLLQRHQLLGRCRLQPGQREHPAADGDGPDPGPGHHGRLDPSAPSRPPSASRSSRAPSPSRSWTPRATAWPGRSATTRRPTRPPSPPARPRHLDPVHGDRQRGDGLLRPYHGRTGHLVVHHVRPADLHPLEQRGDARRSLGQRLRRPSSWASSSSRHVPATSPASGSTREPATRAPTSATSGPAPAPSWPRPPSPARRPPAGSR